MGQRIDPLLLDTYLSNVLRIWDVTYTDLYQLEPLPGTIGGDAQRGQVPEPAVMLSGWNHNGRALPLGASIAFREALETEVLSLGGELTIGAAHAADASWAEETLCVRGVEPVPLIRVVRKFGQAAFWQWDGHRVRLWSGKGASVLGSTAVAAHRLERYPCPWQTANRPPDQVCTVRTEDRRAPGTDGPTNPDREAILTVLGCDTCQHGARLPRLAVQRGGTWTVPSRFGPSTFQPDRQFAPAHKRPVVVRVDAANLRVVQLECGETPDA